MKVTLLLIGTTDDEYLRDGMALYAKRLSHYITINTIEIPALRDVGTMTQEERKRREGALFLKKIPENNYVILLDEKGRQFTSQEFAASLSHLINMGSRITFVVGGPYGFPEEMHKRADMLFSLSKMTFSHQMVRLIFFEQLYRAMTILRGEPYHH